jgi:hypothetical protein
MRLSAALVAVGLVGSALAAAQNPPPPPPATPQRPIFRAGVDIVQLELTVLDGDRKPVRGLTAKDFAVFEDGKPQEIVAVDEVTLGAGDPPPAVWDRAVAPDIGTNDLADRRLVAIVMDGMSCCAAPSALPPPAGRGQQQVLEPPTFTDRWAVDNAVRTAFELIDQLGPHDLAVVVHTHEVIPPDRFTGDRDTLREAVRRFRPITEAICVPFRQGSVFRDLIALMGAAPQALKSVFVLTSPVPPRLRIPPCNPNPTYRIPDTGQIVSVLRSGSGPDPMRDPVATVPIYYLNISGLLAPPTGSGSWSAFLKHGPNPSGGRNVYTTNDLVPAVKDILAENTSYYAIGFRTSRPTTDGNFRRLDIRVTGHGDYTVRTRNGYFRPRPAPRPGDANRDPELPPAPATVAKMLPSFDVTLNAVAAPFARPDGRATLVVAVDVAHPLGDNEIRRDAEDLELRMVAYMNGDPRHDQRTTLHVPIPAGTDRVTTSMRSTLEVAPGEYELWLTVRDPKTTRLGSVFYELEVPDFAAQTVSLSALVFGAEPSEGRPVPPLFSPLLPIVPTVSRDFSVHEAVWAFFQIYQGRTTPLAPVSLTLKIVNAEGATVVDVPETLAPDRFNASRSADYRYHLPLERLTPGKYLLTVEARRGERLSPKRDVVFRVR